MLFPENTVYPLDCLKGMYFIPDKSVDMILCDLPYGVTDCKWDVVLPLNKLWEHYKRIIKENGAIVLTSVQPFTTDLINSNREWFKYCWYWDKRNITGFVNAKKQPLRHIEDILVFYKKTMRYNPQNLIEVNTKRKNSRTVGGDVIAGSVGSTLKRKGAEYVQEHTNYPKQLLHFTRESGLHPTQKPVALFEYLVKTYSNVNDLVLDNCMGSGTTAVACINTGRRYIGFENNLKYYGICRGRVSQQLLNRIPQESKVA